MIYEHEDCGKLQDCHYRSDVGWCPLICLQYRHKDEVRVVRCKDCKHGMKSHLQPRHSKNYLCRHSWEGEYHEPDHFCSYGEKK